VLQEKWKNQAAINEHLATPHFQEFMAKSSELFDGGFEVTAKISGPSRNSAEIAKDHTKLILRMKAKPDKLETVRRGNLEMKRRRERRSGCLQYDLYQGFEGIYDPSVFIADQTWEDRKSLDEAVDYILTETPFYFEDLEETREPILFEPASELAREGGKRIPSVFENAVSGDQELIAGLKKMNPDFAELCLETSEKAYETPLIDQRTKVLLAIVVDVVEQIHGKPFENHLMMAKKQGVTKEELFELLLFLTIYVGFNKAGAYYNEVAKNYGS
jgi:4-carboxymuconolactone decarboxylase